MSFQEFPKWKYHPQHEPVVVDDADAEKALGDGWGDSPVFVAVAADAPAETVESLRAELDSKGIAYDNRWGIKRLKDALHG